MIIACERCQARFRLADEKLKAGGTRVRCSKCQHIFTVMPPEPAPAEETIDFGAFNMERVGEEGAAPPPAPAPPAADEPGEFTFGTAAADSGADTVSVAARGEAPVPPEAPAAAAESAFGEFDFGEEPAAGEAASFVFGETAAPEQGESPGFGETGERDLFPGGPDFGEEASSAWDETGKAGDLAFDFDEPRFATDQHEPFAAKRADGELHFGEIDLGESPPPPAAEPVPASPPQPPAAETAPPPRAATPRTFAAPPVPRKSSAPRVLLLLILLLLLGGAGAYLYLQEDGGHLVERLLVTLKGEQPAAPVEQRIGLAIAGSSYVDNREIGQLLVIQGTATNNFTEVRSAITVKGVLLAADGKVLQQQTVFCGNYLAEEKLRTMRYAQIEEAMNNQFGDSLANMNVKPGAAIRFTVVFRNVPQNLANINVEVVDSKPGGL